MAESHFGSTLFGPDETVTSGRRRYSGSGATQLERPGRQHAGRQHLGRRVLGAGRQRSCHAELHPRTGPHHDRSPADPTSTCATSAGRSTAGSLEPAPASRPRPGRRTRPSRSPCAAHPSRPRPGSGIDGLPRQDVQAADAGDLDPEHVGHRPRRDQTDPQPGERTRADTDGDPGQVATAHAGLGQRGTRSPARAARRAAARPRVDDEARTSPVSGSATATVTAALEVSNASSISAPLQSRQRQRSPRAGVRHPPSAGRPGRSAPPGLVRRRRRPGSSRCRAGPAPAPRPARDPTRPR